MSAIGIGSTPEHYSLSPLQHGMLFHHIQSGRETGVDIEQLEARLHEDIRPEVLTAAWETVTARHAALRTSFRWEGLDAPRQEVGAMVHAPIEVRDLTNQQAVEQERALTAFLEADRRRGFDLAEAPLWRVTLFRIAAAESWMVWTYSHAILDSSYVEVLREVFAVYASLLRGQSPTLATRLAYRAHIEWLHEDLRSRASEIRAFWREQLIGFSTPTNLDALQSARPSGDSGGHDTLRFRLSSGASDRIHALSAQHGASAIDLRRCRLGSRPQRVLRRGRRRVRCDTVLPPVVDPGRGGHHRPLHQYGACAGARHRRRRPD